VPHEAIIGIVYVAASAAAILVADKAPRGAEALHDVLEGSIIWITWPTILKKGARLRRPGGAAFRPAPAVPEDFVPPR